MTMDEIRREEERNYQLERIANMLELLATKPSQKLLHGDDEVELVQWTENSAMVAKPNGTFAVYPISELRKATA